MTAESMAKFTDRYWSDKPDVALLGVDATGAATEDAMTELRHMLAAVRPIGRCTGRQTERWIGKLLRQLHPDDAQDETEGEGPSPQTPSEPVQIPGQAHVSTRTPREGDSPAHLRVGFTAAQIADRLGVSRTTIENHEQRASSALEVHSHPHANSVALQLCTRDHTYALVQSERGLPCA
jgi:hypothetical protein